MAAINMNTDQLQSTLTTLFAELVEGAPATGAYMLNVNDPGLLRSLDRVSAAAASSAAPGRSSIAAHADHLRYGLSLMNRWAAGENPFDDADWQASWRRTTVSDAEWVQLRADLTRECQGWLAVLGTPREVDAVALNGIVGTIAHLAYHLGAIRQINPGLRGPSAAD
jgi:hypothetical protein